MGPFVGKTEYHIKNSVYFVHKIQDLEISPGEQLVSYDVTALITNIPVDKALKVIKLRLEDDDTLYERSILSIDQLIQLLDFVLNTTYFCYQDTFYQQTHVQLWGHLYMCLR